MTAKNSTEVRRRAERLKSKRQKRAQKLADKIAAKQAAIAHSEGKLQRLQKKLTDQRERLNALQLELDDITSAISPLVIEYASEPETVYEPPAEIQEPVKKRTRKQAKVEEAHA